MQRAQLAALSVQYINVNVPGIGGIHCFLARSRLFVNMIILQLPIKSCGRLMLDCKYHTFLCVGCPVRLLRWSFFKKKCYAKKEIQICGLESISARCQKIHLLKQTNQYIGQDLLPRLVSARPALKPHQCCF